MNDETIRKETTFLELKRWQSTGTSSIVFKVTASDSKVVRTRPHTPASLHAAHHCDCDSYLTPLRHRYALQVGKLEPTTADKIFTMAHILSDEDHCNLGSE
jgi:hypothetical protein